MFYVTRKCINLNLIFNASNDMIQELDRLAGSLMNMLTFELHFIFGAQILIFSTPYFMHFDSEQVPSFIKRRNKKGKQKIEKIKAPTI